MYAEYQRLRDEFFEQKEELDLCKKNLAEALQTVAEQHTEIEQLKAEATSAKQRMWDVGHENETLCNTIDRLNRELAQLKKNSFW